MKDHSDEKVKAFVTLVTCISLSTCVTCENSGKTASFRRTTCISHLPFLQSYIDASVKSPRVGIWGVADFLLLTDFRINSRASYKKWGALLTSNHRTSFINRQLNMQKNKLTMIEGSSIKCQVLLGLSYRTVWIGIQELFWLINIFCNVFFYAIAFESTEEHRQEANLKVIQ